MVYLDYAATCPVVKYPQQLYRDVLGQGYFLNPNANYAYKEKRLLEQAENRVKKAIGAKSGKVVFGGTSSQLIENLMSAVAEETNKYHVVCSSYEHDSCFRFHQSTVRDTVLLNGFVETYRDIPNCSDQLFVMWQGVNNITGEIFPVTEIGGICHKHDAFYICDATAMIGHADIPENIDKWCDAFIMDGHKLGTELGIGAMWISDNLDRWLNGFKLHGTPNLAGALAMAQAVEDACVNLYDKDEHIGNLLNYLIDTWIEDKVDFKMIPEYDEEPDERDFVSAIGAFYLPGNNADSLQQYLASKQIYIGIGHSSCSGDADFRVLNAYGLSNDEASNVIRVSFGENSSIEDVKALVEGIAAFRKEYL